MSLSFFFLVSCGRLSVEDKSQTVIEIASEPDAEEIDLKKLRKEYVLSYNKPVVFESRHEGRNGEKVKVIGKYYCLFDSSIIVPGKYNLDDTTKVFRTHNFAEHVTIIINGDTAFSKNITKKDFEMTLPKYLKKYAVLFEPAFEGYDSETGTFDFNFSISIPLTDVGEARKLSILKNGNLKVAKLD